MNGRIIRAEPPQKRLALPRVGKIKIGKKSPKGYPMSVDYFIPAGKYAGLFAKAYGDTPNCIQVIFPSDDPETVCREEYEYRDDAGALCATGDGKTFRVWSARENQYKPFDVDDYPEIMDMVVRRFPTKRGAESWRVRLTLNVIIPLIRGVAGVWTFESAGSASTIPQIRDAFDAMLAERGFVKGILWDLSVTFAKSQKPGDSSRYPVVSLIPNESDENLEKIRAAFEQSPKILPKSTEILPLQ